MTDAAKRSSSDDTAGGKRMAWLDALRALAMLFVIIGHQVPDRYPYFLFTSPVKLPLFFAITGFLFSDRRKGVGDFLRHISFRLAVPWLGWMAIKVLVGLATHTELGLDGFWTSPWLWYLPACIIAETLWFFALRISTSGRMLCLITLLMGLAGLVMARFHILDILKFNTACIAILYIGMGRLFRELLPRLERRPWPVLAALVAGYVALGFLSMALFPGRAIDVNKNKYYFVPVSMTMIFLGCLALFAVGSRVARPPKWLCFIGRETLVFYAFHQYGIAVFKRLPVIGRLDLPFLLRLAMSTVFSCAACAVAALLIDRFLPELSGRRRRARRPS